MNKLQKLVVKWFKISQEQVTQYSVSPSGYTTLPLRRCGNTTRLVDQYIQLLFMYGQIHPHDHFHSRESDSLLFRRILDRLHYEHPNLEMDVRHHEGTMRIKNWKPERPYQVCIGKTGTSYITGVDPY